MPLADRYLLLDCLYNGRDIMVHTARARQSGDSVILKMNKPNAACERLRHEYGILQGLDLLGIVRARGFEEEGSELALVLEDLGGETLASRLAGGPLPLREALRIAAEIADALGQIHHHRIIHKDINPTNILLDKDDRVRVFDFDIATCLPRELQSVRSPNLLAGTLPYISPEQTGRMNRAIDHRTDLYSLGATLYAALTGRVPFSTRDPMELVHCHIAKTPARPSEVDPSIPEVVSDIVMRLLEKTAEARYLGALGLKADLDRCLLALDQEGHVDPFALGQDDVSDRFQIAQKLYGREDESAVLTGAFRRATQGTPELVLVTGSSGIGKSTFIYELYRALAENPGRFVSGKFDQLKRDIPYSALLQALSELVRSLLAEPEEQLALIRARILSAAGGIGRVLTEVLPEVEHIIGPQPPVPELPAAEGRNRFRIVFEGFLQVFTRYEEVLVIFLDDLQWADAATLEILPSLLGDPRAGAILVIGAYRDNEVSPGHPLLSMLAALEKERCGRTRIAIEPLRALHVRELIEDTLAIPPDEAQPLAELVWRRTGGNPLLVNELLTMLYKNGLIEIDPRKRRFTFDLDRIERAPGTENVGQLIAARAAALGVRTREILQLASVLGHRFDLGTLSIVAASTPLEARAALSEALQEELIVTLGEASQGAYRFLHDRIQHTVYASIPEEERDLVHHRTGQLLLRSRPHDDQDAWLFEVLRHVNLVPARVVDPEERVALARLNLTAAQRARAAGAFSAAAHHFAAGIGFMPERAWSTHHGLMFELCLGRAECEYLSGNHAGAERLFALLLAQAGTDEERVEVYERISIYKGHLEKFQDALDAALQALDLLGVKLERDPKPHRVLIELLSTKRALRGRSPHELSKLPETVDPRVKVILRVFRRVGHVAILTNRNLYATAAMHRVRISAQHGNSSESAGGYIAYGILLSGILGDHAGGEAFGRLALDLSERYPNKAIESLIKYSYGWFLNPWRNPIRRGLSFEEESRQSGLMTGELVYAGYAISCAGVLQWFASYPLDSLMQICEQDIEIARKLKHSFAEPVLRTLRQMVLALRGQTRHPGSFETADFDEGDHVGQLLVKEEKHSLHLYWLLKIMVLFVLGHRDQARSFAASARPMASKALMGSFSCAEFCFYDALLAASSASDKGGIERQRELLLIRRHLRQLHKWADNAPMNFRHKYLLVGAELARLTHDDGAAVKRYEEAIALAREGDFARDEAIALELASEFHRARGLSDVAVTYLSRARQAYARWGARARVASLDHAYPGLSARAEAEDRSGLQDISTTASTRVGGALDVPSMIKACQALSGEVSLEKLLLRLMEIIAENAGAERGALVFQQDGALVIVAEFNAQHGARVPARPSPLGSGASVSPGIVTYVFRTRESVVLNDATEAGAFATDAYVISRKPKAILCTPLLQKGEVKGAVYLENNLVSGAFTRERTDLLSVLCAQMAISIDNAHLVGSLEQMVNERTSALKAAQARLIHLERETTETQMAGGFAHEMRNALAGAKLVLARVLDDTNAGPPSSLCSHDAEVLSQVLLRVKDEMSEDAIADVAALVAHVNGDMELLDSALQKIDRSVTRGLRITGLILDYAQLGSTLPGDERISAEALVHAVLEDVAEDVAEHRIEVSVEIPIGCVLFGHEQHFHRILRNLVLNARDALVDTRAGGKRALTIRVADEATRQVLSVSDTGVGIPVELHDKVFEPFFTTRSRESTGLGLGIVRKLAGLYGGVVELVSERGMGATFRVVLPRQGAEGDRAAQVRA